MLEPREGRSGDVVIWRNELLPGSETFIVDQAAALRRWTPRYAGLTTVPSALRVDPDLVVGSYTRLGDLRVRWLRARGRSRALAKLLRRPSVGVVHAHFGCDAVLVAREAGRAGLPLVVSFHGYDVTKLPHDPDAGPRYREQLADLFARADVLLASSDFLAARLLQLGAPAHKLARHYTGIPLPAPFRPSPTQRRVLFAGRMVEVKGVGDLLAAVAALPAGLRDTPVRLYGDGPLRDELEHRARELGVRAEFLGHQPSHLLARDLARGGVFCGPSKRTPVGAEEGLGTVFLEASAHGLAVVAYRSGGVPEAVVDGVTGLLCPEGDVDALSASLAALLADPDRAGSLGLAGRARVEQLFDIRHQTARLEQLYDGLQSSPVSAPAPRAAELLGSPA